MENIESSSSEGMEGIPFPLVPFLCDASKDNLEHLYKEFGARYLAAKRLGSKQFASFSKMAMACVHAIHVGLFEQDMDVAGLGMYAILFVGYFKFGNELYQLKVDVDMLNNKQNYWPHVSSVGPQLIKFIVLLVTPTQTNTNSHGD